MTVLGRGVRKQKRGTLKQRRGTPRFYIRGQQDAIPPGFWGNRGILGFLPISCPGRDKAYARGAHTQGAHVGRTRRCAPTFVARACASSPPSGGWGVQRGEQVVANSCASNPPNKGGRGVFPLYQNAARSERAQRLSKFVLVKVFFLLHFFVTTKKEERKRK
jgi:hypothetical protein